MSPDQSFEMTQEKPVLLILKLRRANNFVINVIVYPEYDSEVEMMNNRKVICHEYALKKHAESKRNLPNPLSRCVILTNECPHLQHKDDTPCPRTKFMQAKRWQLMHNKTHAEYFYSITVV